MAAKVPFVTLAAGPISGHIGDTSGNAVAGAELQACLPKGGQCYDTSTTPSGNFKEAVPYGRYTLTAFPPAETSLAQSTSSRSWAVNSPAGVAGATSPCRCSNPCLRGQVLVVRTGASQSCTQVARHQ